MNERRGFIARGLAFLASCCALPAIAAESTPHDSRGGDVRLFEVPSGIMNGINGFEIQQFRNGEWRSVPHVIQGQFTCE